MDKKLELLISIEKLKKANAEGYAGCMPNGNLVDRREHPEGYPIAPNSMFGIKAPRCVRCNEITPIAELKKSLCKNCQTKTQ